MRQEYEMTEDDLAVVLEACKPVVWLAPQGHGPTLPQAYANDAWRALGHKMGFDWMTAKSVAGKGNRFFTAEKSAPPTSFEETVQAVHDKIERLTRERDEARAACAVMRPIVIEYAELHHRHMYGGRLQDPMGVHALLIRSSPGQPLLDELDRLRRLEAAVRDDELVDSCAVKAVSSKPTRPEHTAINIYRAALLTTMKGE